MKGNLFDYELFLEAEKVISLLKKQHKTLCCCESLTGGGVSFQLTRVSGASKVFLGGIVSYTDHIKNSIVGVDGVVLSEKGAVSRECAKEMAQKTRALMGADYALSLTGFAEKCEDEKGIHEPFAFICFCGEATEKFASFSFEGDRDEVRLLCAQRALLMATEELEK